MKPNPTFQVLRPTGTILPVVVSLCLIVGCFVTLAAALATGFDLVGWQ